MRDIDRIYVLKVFQFGFEWWIVTPTSIKYPIDNPWVTQYLGASVSGENPTGITNKVKLETRHHSHSSVVKVGRYPAGKKLNQRLEMKKLADGTCRDGGNSGSDASMRDSPTVSLRTMLMPT